MSILSMIYPALSALEPPTRPTGDPEREGTKSIGHGRVSRGFGVSPRSEEAEADGIELRLRINGYRVRLTLWTELQWSRLSIRPVDAICVDGGHWCLVRTI